MPKGKFEVQQKQLDELPKQRPLILYITAPISSKDHALTTAQDKHFQSNPSLPNGVRQREGNTFNFCAVEVSPTLEVFEMQVASALDEYKEVEYKVVVINAHGSDEGVLFKDEGEKVVLDGRRFGKIVAAHTHRHNLHVVVFASQGHKFSNEFYSYIKKDCPREVSDVVAITYFTSETSPTSWDMVTTAGNGHVAITRGIGDFIKSNIEPNSPCKLYLKTK